ncbi:hypothetical protein [Nocardioides sp.]|uniref:hypothetical protein n=1 Tax=Nocardioides sp. TaxID=35761 RepID=UPI0027364D8F|nr:hypothetical protein [Nocardioides sp.]MDP3892987.1 hypothetical protein [Nocardioides sp.]
MSTTAVRSTPRTNLTAGAAYGAGAGVVASVAMGMYAMVASYLKDTGFFTPLHHIASLVADPSSMVDSMTAHQMEGDGFVVTAGVALLGAVIHMMTGAMYGAVLGLAVARLRVGTSALAGIGLAYGALVFVMSAFVGLPLAATVLDAGDPIADMASMAGWWTFLVEHLVFGLVAAVLVGGALRKRA